MECEATRPERKPIDHRGPAAIDVTGAWYFITLCAEGHQPWVMDGRACAPRTPDSSDARTPDSSDAHTPPTFDEIARVILQHAREYHLMGKWRISLFLVMPDHLHFIVHAPNVDVDDGNGGVRGAPALPRVIGNWKHWLTAKYGIRFQVNFWDTRLRNDALYAEKFRYICNNPVRKGLCEAAREWPYVIAFDRATGAERVHR